MAFYWSLSDSKSPQLFRTILINLADLPNAVIWMSSDSLVFQSFYQSFGDHSKFINYD